MEVSRVNLVKVVYRNYIFIHGIVFSFLEEENNVLSFHFFRKKIFVYISITVYYYTFKVYSSNVPISFRALSFLRVTKVSPQALLSGRPAEGGEAVLVLEVRSSIRRCIDSFAVLLVVQLQAF
jgi:hypothetical protein